MQQCPYIRVAEHLSSGLDNLLPDVWVLQRTAGRGGGTIDADTGTEQHQAPVRVSRWSPTHPVIPLVAVGYRRGHRMQVRISR